jgi:uncharacterized protein YjbI with pentapeptide repeats
MANEEHLKILRRGVEVWNQWRKDNLDIEPDLSLTDLSGADLSKVDLWGANLSGANLRGADLSKADLSQTDLSRVNFSRADLSFAKFSFADLSRANFSEANLTAASLFRARLLYTNLDRANLTGAWLRETQCAGWSVKGVICEHIYWDTVAEEKIDYAPGEFERLYAEKPKIRLFYKKGIEPFEVATVPALIQYLEEMQGCVLRFVSVTESAGRSIVELAIENTDNQSPEQVKQLKNQLQIIANQAVEFERKFLAEEKQKLQLEGWLDELRLWFRQQQLLLASTKQGDNALGDKYEISGQAGAIGPNTHAHNITFNQLVNQINQSIDLSALAKELSELRQAIKDKQDSSPQADIALGELAKAEIAATEKDTPKVVEHLKAAGKWTMNFAREIGKDVVVAAIKQAMGIL